MVYKTEIFLIITNLIIPITVSYITARTTLSRTIKKQIYDKRETVYFELFQLLDNLLKNPYLVYQHKEFVLPLTNMRIKLKLFASQKLINKFERLYDAILTTFERYQEKYRSETALSTNEARKSEGDVTEQGLLDEEESYCKKHLLNEELLSERIEEIITAMRKDLKVDRFTERILKYFKFDKKHTLRYITVNTYRRFQTKV